MTERTVGENCEPMDAGLSLRNGIAPTFLEQQADEFLANVSHDLRTPLAAIKASIGVVLANEPPDTPPPLRQMYRNIDAAADRMIKLVHDLLELTRLRVGRGRLRIQHCDLRTLARRAARSIEPLAQERGQRLRLELPRRPVTGLVDAERLEHALLNLLSNANRHGRANGLIVLRLQRKKRRIIFTVVDDGPGIELEEHERIFERFYRPELEAARRNQGGGLGLPLARAMVELHGGTVGVDSTPGQGATFWIDLPARPDTGLKGDTSGVSPE